MSLWRVGDREIQYMEEALQGGLTGRFNQRLEDTFSERFGVPYAIGVNSGTSALHCCLGAMGLGPGDEVIVPALTFAAPALAVCLTGATPVFADVDEQTFTMDPGHAQSLVTGRTRAIIPVALYGLSADMDPILRLAKEHGLYVIEDCAECFLGEYRGRLAGTMGDMAIFSFERSKHVTSGNGGMILVKDASLAQRVRQFSIVGYSTLRAGAYEAKPPREVIQNPPFVRHLFVSPNYRLPEVCAAMALAQVERLDAFVDRRCAVGQVYAEAVAGCDWLVPQKTPAGYRHTYWTYVLRLDSQKSGISWTRFREVFLELGGAPFYAAWLPNYKEPAMAELGLEVQCPVTEKIQPKLVQLKTNFETDEEARRQADSLRQTIRVLEAERTRMKRTVAL